MCVMFFVVCGEEGNGRFVGGDFHFVVCEPSFEVVYVGL